MQARLKGLTSVLHSSSEQYAHNIPELVSPLLEKLLSDSTSYTHVVSAHSSSAKSILPRVAARLDLPAVSDITSVEHDGSSNSTTFTRPIYAGNAISTVRAPDSVRVKFFTVRSTAFKASAADEAAQVEDKAVDPVEVSDAPTQHVRTDLTKSDRPDLGSASRVVSGGRALKNAETFKATLEPLADALGAAIGASRAAVDAGYADNSLQVGQTGKVVAPELYMAIGISGAIQHLAGMKDSKLIVAINKVGNLQQLQFFADSVPPRTPRLPSSRLQTLVLWRTCTRRYPSWCKSSSSRHEKSITCTQTSPKPRVISLTNGLIAKAYRAPAFPSIEEYVGDYNFAAGTMFVMST